MGTILKKSLHYLITMYEIPKQAQWTTYRDAFTDLLNKGATLVADRGDLHINHKLDDPIPDDAQLYIICNEDTFSELARRSYISIYSSISQWGFQTTSHK